jgi:UDP-glucose 4-epimerase
MKTCIIFGGNGFIGSHLAEELVKTGYEVKIFDTFKYGTKNLANCINNVELIKGDFLNQQDIYAALKDVDVLFHYISTTNPVTAVQNPVFDIETNVIGSINLFQAALKNDVERIVFPSSGGTIYGETNGKPMKEKDPTNPVNPYSISKLAVERYLEFFLQNYGMKYTVLRYSNPYGERQNPLGTQGVIPIFLYKVSHGESPVVFGDGATVRDYIYIKDAIDATLAVLQSNPKETLFNIGSGEGFSINQVVDTISEVTGKDIHPVYTESPKNSISKVVLDISKVSKVTGWTPKTSLKDGVIKTWDWINSEY